MSEPINPDIFKAYDVRGKVGSDLTGGVTAQIGRAVANWLPNEGIVAVGRDMRPDSAELAQGMIDGLVAQGREVWDIGEVTSDMIYFATGQFGLAGGVMITASHNPGEYNGIKFCREEAKPVGIESGLLEIRDLAIKDQWPKAEPGRTTTKDVVDDWIDHVLSFVDTDKLQPYKIVVDAGNGMEGKIFPELEPHVPFEVTEMYFELDGTFPNHVANPIEPANIKDLVDRVIAEKADVGLAFDGDGDRAVLIDENGQALAGTVMTAIMAKYFLGKYPGSTILYNATCGWVVPETVEANGGKAIRTRVGHSYIKAEMRNQQAVFAGESSGHYYFKDNFMADSGLIAGMVTLAVLSTSGKKLSELAEEFRKYEQLPETNFEVADKQAVLDELTTAFSKEKQDLLDGLTIWTTNAWCNIRASNTEPILRLNAEGRSKNDLDELVGKVKAVIEKY